MSDFLVLGLDVGGTWSRALVATSAGGRIGAGRAPGGNPTAHGSQAAATAIGNALQDALVGVRPSGVAAGAIGLAGARKLDADPRTAATFERIWRDAGLTCPMLVVSDAVTAFAAGTAEPSGSLLLSGTGAVAATVRNRELARVADGHGWLLGDDGSGFWLGREAARTTLAALDGRRPLSRLSRLVLTELLGADEVTDSMRETAVAVVNQIHASAPVELARLAPLVTRAHAEGDATAARIVAEAAEQLVATLRSVRSPGEDSPIVLAGGVLTADTAVSELVRAQLVAQWPEAPVTVARDGAAGAAWLAATQVLGYTAAAAELHERLVQPADGRETAELKTSRGM